MLRQLSEFWLRHRQRNNNAAKVRILVLAYNRTLRGYISHLAEQQLQNHPRIQIDINTFSGWAINLIGVCDIIDNHKRITRIEDLGRQLGIPMDFLCDEVEYCLSRFRIEKIKEYLTAPRAGRGVSPRMDRRRRARLINEVIKPYEEYKRNYRLKDWNDLALMLLDHPANSRYDIIIADELQDFSANQIRAVMHHTAHPSTIVFIIDSAQRIYPRGWNWREVGIKINPNRSFLLRENHRNTVEICNFVKPLLEGMDLGSDGYMPDLDSCRRHGPVPQLLKGRYSAQCFHAISKIRTSIDLDNESVAFAHPKAGGWFDYLRNRLRRKELGYVDMSRRKVWPQGRENIALITMHSAKGLEFDHMLEGEYE